MSSEYMLKRFGDKIHPSSDFKPFCISSTSSYCRLLVLVQAGYQFNKVTWETHLLHGSPKLRMADTIKGFALIYKEIERDRDRENVCVPYTFRWHFWCSQFGLWSLFLLENLLVLLRVRSLAETSFSFFGWWSSEALYFHGKWGLWFNGWHIPLDYLSLVGAQRQLYTNLVAILSSAKCCSISVTSDQSPLHLLPSIFRELYCQFQVIWHPWVVLMQVPPRILIEEIPLHWVLCATYNYVYMVHDYTNLRFVSTIKRLCDL